MYRKLKDENAAIGLLVKDMKTFALSDVARITDRIAKIYGEPVREKLISQPYTHGLTCHFIIFPPFFIGLAMVTSSFHSEPTLSSQSLHVARVDNQPI